MSLSAAVREQRELRHDARHVPRDVSIVTRRAPSQSYQGVVVRRATLAQEPGKFVANLAVRNALEVIGTGALPAIVVDGVLKSTGAYPARDQLAGWAGVNPAGTNAPEVRLPMLAGAALPLAGGGCCGGGGSC